MMPVQGSPSTTTGGSCGTGWVPTSRSSPSGCSARGSTGSLRAPRRSIRPTRSNTAFGLVAHSQYSGDIIRECAEAAPLEFVTKLFPRFARFDLSVPKEWISAPSRWGGPDDQLRNALADAMRTVAREDPAALDSLIEGEPHGESKWMTALLLQAWSANPEAYAERIVQFLLDSPDERLDIGYSSAAGGTDMLAAMSRTAIAAASPLCSAESFANLESAILAFVPDWERQHRFVRRTALALLRALDESRLSESARRRIQELERRFPEAPERGAPRPPSPEDFAAQSVGPPISPTDQQRMTNAQWLAAMDRYRNEREDWTPGGRIVGGANELARGLEEFVGKIRAASHALLNRWMVRRTQLTWSRCCAD